MANRRAHGVALGGMLTALSLILLLAAGIVPAGELVFPAICGILLVVVVFELNVKWAWSIFTAVSLLGLLLCPSKSVVIYYIFFFGHYPLVKSYVERLHSRVLQWVLKILLFNVCSISAYWLIVHLFGVSDVVTRYGYLLLLVLANTAFILYDIAVSRLIVTYVYHIRKYLHWK